MPFPAESSPNKPHPSTSRRFSGTPSPRPPLCSCLTATQAFGTLASALSPRGLMLSQASGVSSSSSIRCHPVSPPQRGLPWAVSPPPPRPPLPHLLIQRSWQTLGSLMSFASACLSPPCKFRECPAPRGTPSAQHAAGRSDQR